MDRMSKRISGASRRNDEFFPYGRDGRKINRGGDGDGSSRRSSGFLRTRRTHRFCVICPHTPTDVATGSVRTCGPECDPGCGRRSRESESTRGHGARRGCVGSVGEQPKIAATTLTEPCGQVSIGTSETQSCRVSRISHVRQAQRSGVQTLALRCRADLRGRRGCIARLRQIEELH